MNEQRQAADAAASAWLEQLLPDRSTTVSYDLRELAVLAKWFEHTSGLRPRSAAEILRAAMRETLERFLNEQRPSLPSTESGALSMMPSIAAKLQHRAKGGKLAAWQRLIEQAASGVSEADKVSSATQVKN